MVELRQPGQRGFRPGLQQRGRQAVLQLGCGADNDGEALRGMGQKRSVVFCSNGTFWKGSTARKEEKAGNSAI